MTGDIPSRAAHTPDVVVVGAGIIGLTSAIALADAGLAVEVVAEQPPHITTSVLATAMVGPTFGMSGETVSRWESVTRAELSSTDAPGVHHCAGRFASRTPGLIPPHAEHESGYAPCDDDELPDGFASGFWATVPLVDMPPYLDHLRHRFVSAGGRLEIRRVDSLGAAAGVAPVVVNCAGLGAADLADDRTLTPVRGPKVIVRNPGLDTFFIEGPPTGEWASFHPHGDHVVLGGSTVGTDPEPSPDELDAIITRCAAIEPALREAEVLDHAVGFRPGRTAIRLDIEEIDGIRVVHNYGHGGIGVTVAWGCAHEVTSLLRA
ncbi:MAG: FAD-dependent oxidoreductase [Acidimicrobiales bacterium]